MKSICRDCLIEPESTVSFFLLLAVSYRKNTKKREHMWWMNEILRKRCTLVTYYLLVKKVALLARCSSNTSCAWETSSRHNNVYTQHARHAAVTFEHVSIQCGSTCVCGKGAETRSNLNSLPHCSIVHGCGLWTVHTWTPGLMHCRHV